VLDRSEGTVLRTLRFPENFHLELVSSGLAAGVLTDELGVERLALATIGSDP